MESPGEYLRREREHRGITLSAIYESTRVPMKLLSALEADEFDSLPHPTFTKGFIRSYCKRLGLDETDAILRYEMFMRERSEREGNLSVSVPQERKKPPFPVDKRYLIASAAAAIVIIAALYFTLVRKGHKAALPAAPAAKEAAQTQTAAVQPQQLPQSPPQAKATAQPGAQPADVKKTAAAKVEKPPAKDEQRSVAAKDAAKPGDAPEKKHSITISAAEPVWIKMGVDDKPAFNVILKQGESASWRAEKGFQLVVGNAGGVSIMFDGKKMGPLGPSGKVVNVRLPQGLGDVKPAGQPERQ